MSAHVHVYAINIYYHVFDVMATGPKSTYVTIHISKEHVTV